MLVQAKKKMPIKRIEDEEVVILGGVVNNAELQPQKDIQTENPLHSYHTRAGKHIAYSEDRGKAPG